MARRRRGGGKGAASKANAKAKKAVVENGVEDEGVEKSEAEPEGGKVDAEKNPKMYGKFRCLQRTNSSQDEEEEKEAEKPVVEDKPREMIPEALDDEEENVQVVHEEEVAYEEVIEASVPSPMDIDVNSADIPFSEEVTVGDSNDSEPKPEPQEEQAPEVKVEPMVVEEPKIETPPEPPPPPPPPPPPEEPKKKPRSRTPKKKAAQEKAPSTDVAVKLEQLDITKEVQEEPKPVRPRRSKRVEKKNQVLAPKSPPKTPTETDLVKKEPDEILKPPPPPPLLTQETLDTEKPVKVKSRWRRSSELEMGGGTEPNCTALSPVVPDLPPLPPPEPPKPDPVIGERMKTFQCIPTNEYLTERSVSKEAKRMICDCTLTKEEISRNELGCGDDCLNRLLMIECGSRCLLGSQCSNRRFQRIEYAKCEVTNTQRKGLGLKSLQNLPSGSFIMEYVGEVLEPKEFKKRAKEYSKDKNQHFYFMALKSDTIIDATGKGNISRFINHSCDPNAETQKWTVNGELRIGFFSKRFINVGEEITFDYQLQRYGKEAQRCFCESANCRGWIGEDPEKEKEKKEGGKKEKKERRRKEEKRREIREFLNDMDHEEEVDKLCSTGLKNQKHTLTLCRLMVRVEDHSTRSRILDIIKDGDTRCLRLFIDYHGLALLWSWMMDCTPKLKLKILDSLTVLPVQNKTMLQDSKVLSLVEKWAKPSSEPSSIGERKERSSTEDENSTSPNDGEVVVKKEPPAEVEEAPEPKESEKEPEVTPPPTTEEDEEALKEELRLAIEKSEKLLEKWSSLKEEFRIPKKQRIEQMKEHEREADMAYLDHGPDPRDYQSYDRKFITRHYSTKENMRFKERRRRESPTRHEDRFIAKLGKAERRQLFELQVEEEERQKRHMEEMWRKHQEECRLLGLDPDTTAMGDTQKDFPCYYNSASGTWTTYPAESGMMVDGEGKPVGTTPPLFSPSQPPPNFGTPQGPPSFTSQPPPSPYMGTNAPRPPFMDSSQYPPPGYIEPPQLQTHLPPTHLPPPHLPPQHLQSPHLPPPQTHIPPPGYHGEGPPPHLSGPPPQVFHPPFNPGGPPPPFRPPFQQPPPPIQPAAQQRFPYPVPTPTNLPPRWKYATDPKGRFYFYHVKTRKTQWQLPVYDPTDNSESSSESSESSEEDTSSDDDDVKEDDEEEFGEEEAPAETGAEIENIIPKQEDEPETQAPEVQEPVLKKRREGLVQVNIISPRDDDMKGISKSKIRETKEKLMRHKMKLKTRARRARQSSAAYSKCEADTSSGPTRRVNNVFRDQMANYVVSILNVHRKPDCKVGRIVSTDDFKHLARKITHFLMNKELSNCSNPEDFEFSDAIKSKAKEYIKKYMSRCGPVYKRPDESLN